MVKMFTSNSFLIMTKITVIGFCYLLIILPVTRAKYCVLPSGFYQGTDSGDIKYAVVEEHLSNDSLVQSCCIQTDTDILYSPTQYNHNKTDCLDDLFEVKRENDFQMTLSYIINRTSDNQLSKKFVFKETNRTNIEAETIIIIGKIAKFNCGSSDEVQSRCLPPITTIAASNIETTEETTHGFTVTTAQVLTTEIKQPSIWEKYGNYIVYSILGSIIIVLLIIIGCQCGRISRMKKECYKTSDDQQDATLSNLNSQNVSGVDGHAQKQHRKSYFEFWTPRFNTNRGGKDDKSNTDQEHAGAKRQRRKSYLLSWVLPKTAKESKETIEIQSKIAENSESGNSDGLVWSNIHQQIEKKAVRSKNEYVLTNV